MNIENEENFKPKKIAKKKRKRSEPEKEEQRCLRSKKTKLSEIETDIKVPEETDESTLNSTPNQRKKVFNIFGILSPFIICNIPTMEEVRRFSLAVHIWAEKCNGGVGFLQNSPLTERHIKDIISLTGPGSRWKLIPDRSVTEYLSIWQNAAKGQEHFHGDKETGYQCKLKLHKPSLQFCPFAHCKSVPEIFMNTDQLPDDSRIVDKTYRRELFTSEKTSKQIKTIASPTKEELQSQNKNLKLRIEKLTSSNFLSKTKKISNPHEEKLSFKQPKLVKCSHTNCDMTFVSVFGMDQHFKKAHGESSGTREKQECPYCGKRTIYIYQHIKTVHKEILKNDKCDICNEVIKSDMRKHRSTCNRCTLCGYQNRKKDRLIKHIQKCQEEQTEPLDLRSPRKDPLSETNEPIDLSTPKKDMQMQQSIRSPDPVNLVDTGNTESLNQFHVQDYVSSGRSEGVQRAPDRIIYKSKSRSEIVQNSPDRFKNTSKVVQTSQKDYKVVCSIEDQASNDFETVEIQGNKFEDENIEKCCSLGPRTRFPFDSQTDPYESEYQSDDELEFTLKRRQIKDTLELELRAIDKLKPDNFEGDDELLKLFQTFMRNKTNRNQTSGAYSSDVSTVGMYTGAVRNYVLPAFHKLFKPFDARWIIDCTTTKDCTFDGEKMFYVKPEEPIYITPKVVETALEMSKQKGGQHGGQRGTIIQAAVQLMNFVELYFNGKLNQYGNEPYANVIIYHQAVQKFISATGAWKMCNDEKDKAQHENRVRQDYVHPNREVEVLQKYKTYLNSSERLKIMNKVLYYSNKDDEKPTDREITEIGKITMGEIVAATGCRPVVLLKMPNSAYIDKQPGFNPYETSDGDCILDEDDGKEKIYRRVNPNLPPAGKACQHQLELKVAECPVMCEKRCEPDGYNILITWDKTSGTSGPSYLHIPKELKHMMDIYDIKKVRFFKGRKTSHSKKDDWIYDDETPFFLNSACSSFKKLNLAHISEIMGIDVTAYSFRKIVSTWALSHASVEIRRAEQEALQHSLKVAQVNYQQNKQIQPQQLVQKYIEEENLFPDSLKEGLTKTDAEVKGVMKCNEDKRTKKRLETLLKRKEEYEDLKIENKPLGPTHRIHYRNRRRFIELLMELNGFESDSVLVDMKPLLWRKLTIRTVCTDKDKQGQELRELWKEMYKGDLRWGVRDARFKAEEKNWPRKKETNKKDRNSWIATSIRQSFMSEKKRSKKMVDVD